MSPPIFLKLNMKYVEADSNKQKPALVTRKAGLL